MRGFWKRPVSRTYGYNLEVGEHYYSPMTTYLDAERGSRGETPGALTYNERLAKKWIYGRRYEATELRDRVSDHDKCFEYWLEIIFCELCGNPRSKFAGDAGVQTRYSDSQPDAMTIGPWRAIVLM